MIFGYHFCIHNTNTGAVTTVMRDKVRRLHLLEETEIDFYIFLINVAL